MWNEDCCEFCPEYEKLVKCNPTVCKNFFNQSINNENMLEKKQLPLRLGRNIKLLIHLKGQSKLNQQVYCKHKTSYHLYSNKMHLINTLKWDTKIRQKYCKVCWGLFARNQIWLNGMWLYKRRGWELVVHQHQSVYFGKIARCRSL